MHKFEFREAGRGGRDGSGIVCVAGQAWEKEQEGASHQRVDWAGFWEGAVTGQKGRALELESRMHRALDTSPPEGVSPRLS